MTICSPCTKGDHDYCHAGDVFAEAVNRGGLPYGMTEDDRHCDCAHEGS